MALRLYSGKRWIPHRINPVDTDHSNNNWRNGLAGIQLCVSEIREWMNQNMLKLNDDKTVLIVFTSKYKQDLYNDLSITIGDTVVDCSSQVKDLVSMFLILQRRADFIFETLAE